MVRVRYSFGCRHTGRIDNIKKQRVKYPQVMKEVIGISDIVLEILDARYIEETRNVAIEEEIDKLGKKLIFVFNKCDLISDKDISKLKKDYANGFFVSSLKRTGIKVLREALVNMSENWEREGLRLGIVGYPNAGKSSLINALVPQARLKVKSVSGTTKKTEWLRMGRLRIMDSPGVIPSGDDKIKIGLTASKDPHKIRNPEKVAFKIVEFIMRKRVDVLERFYAVEVSEGESVYDVFLGIGKKKGFLLKGGVVDENRCAIRIIDDWQRGRIGLK